MLYQILNFNRKTGVGQAIEAALIGPAFNSGYVINILSSQPLPPGAVVSMKPTNKWFEADGESVYIRAEVVDKEPCLIYQ